MTTLLSLGTCILMLHCSYSYILVACIMYSNNMGHSHINLKKAFLSL